MVVHGGRGTEANCFADLAYRWWVATPAHVLFDEVEDAALAACELGMGAYGEGSHASIVRVFAPRVKHLFGEQMFVLSTTYEHPFARVVYTRLNTPETLTHQQ
jgi:hypothetical protein